MKVQVPINPDVLKWAIDESGYSDEDVAHKAKIEFERLVEILGGEAAPSMTETRALCRTLHRPLPVLLKRNVPQETVTNISLRAHPNEARRALSPREALVLRQARHLQGGMAWIRRELDEEPTALRTITVAEEPSRAAMKLRDVLGVSVDDQIEWRNPARAYDEWRRVVESLGILVLNLPMGSDGARGFALFDSRAPAIVVNTAWNPSVRIFTLFHEMGHLLTRTDSVCIGTRIAGESPKIERWCERFAASLLLPETALEHFLIDKKRWTPGGEVTDWTWGISIAGAFSVSVTASVIRLIDLGYATWDIYHDIPKARDHKQGGGGGGGGESRVERRLRELGVGVSRTFVRAMERDVIDEDASARYLRLAVDNLEDLERELEVVDE